MQSNSVGYILGFCAAVCLACSVIVSTAAVGLKSRQEFNKRLDRKKKVLTVAGLIKEGQSVTAKKVSALFQKRIKAVVVDLKTGLVDAKATKKAKDFDQQKAKKDPKTSSKAKKNLAGVKRLPHKALVYYVSSKDMDAKGKGFQLSQYIFPVEGKGLWSTLYGFVALAPDMNQIKGLTFYQHAETPGLGGEVDNRTWKAKWPGRLVYGPRGSSYKSWKTPKIEVIKGVAGKPKADPYRVDGLSGATITSKGVSHLLRFWLGSNGFSKFIRNTLSGTKAAKAAPKAPARRVVVRKAPARRVVVRKAPARPTTPKAPARRVEVRKAAPKAPVVRKAPAARKATAARPAVRKAAAKAAPASRPAAAPTTRPTTRPGGAK